MIGPLTIRFRSAVKVNIAVKTTRERERERERERSNYSGSVAGKRWSN
jgi:hypothetical protein